MDYKFGDKIIIIKDIYIDGELKARRGQRGEVCGTIRNLFEVRLMSNDNFYTIKIPQDNHCVKKITEEKEFKLKDKVIAKRNIMCNGKILAHKNNVGIVIAKDEYAYIVNFNNTAINDAKKCFYYSKKLKDESWNTTIYNQLDIELYRENITEKFQKGDLIITKEDVYYKNHPDKILVPRGTKGVIIYDWNNGYIINFIDLKIADHNKCFNNYLRTNNILWTTFISNCNQFCKLSIAKPVTEKVNLNKNINKKGDIMKNTFEIKGIEVKDNGATFRVDSVKVEVDYSVTEAIKLTDATVRIMPQLVNVFNKLIK